jgi:hypothetical protein
MGDKLAGAFEGLPKWAKGVISVAVVGIGALALFTGYKKLKGLSLKRADGQKEVVDYGKEVNKNNLSYPQSQYATFASILFSAMDGMGENYSSIKGVISKLKNHDDWDMLVKVYGNKKNTDHWYKTSFQGSLTAWLEDELSSSEHKEIGDMLSKIGVQF